MDEGGCGWLVVEMMVMTKDDLEVVMVMCNKSIGKIEL
jgi:hypothetical protein